MATLPTRSQPSVTIEQVIQTQNTPPALAALGSCMVAPCKQVVEPTTSTSTGGTVLNGQARIALPAILQAVDASGSPKVYPLTAKQDFAFSVNGKGKRVWSVPASGNYTPQAVATALRKMMLAEAEGDAVAESVGEGTGTSFRLRSVGKDEFQTIEVDPEGPAAPASVVGTVDLTTLTFPGDVQGLTIQVAVDDEAAETITLGAVANAAAMAAAIAALTGATSSVNSDDFLVVSTDALGAGRRLTVVGGTLLSVVGITAGTYAGEGSTAGLLSAFGFHTTDYAVGASRYAQHELVIPPSALPNPLPDNTNANPNHLLVFETDTLRAFLNIGGTNLSEALRTSALLRRGGSISTVDDGNGDNKTPFLNFAGQNFLNPTPLPAVITGAGAPNFASLSNKTLILGDGRAPRTIYFGTVAAIADVVDAVQAQFDPSDGILAENDSGSLKLTCTRKRADSGTQGKGEESFIVIYGGTAFSGGNYLDTGGTPTLVPGRTSGAPYKAKVGDELYVDGVFVGNIAKVAPGGVTTRIKLDRQVNLSFTGMLFHIVAKGLVAGDTTRPEPDLTVEGDGTMILKPGITRSDVGLVNETVVSDTLIPASAYVYCGYTALRLDVTARSGGLLRLDTPEQVEALLSPIDERNPLGLISYMALRVAPSFPLFALGVDATSEDQPMGTSEAYGRAASHLEAFDIYAIGELSPDREVLDIFQTHVSAMSKPTGKRERLVVGCPAEPVEAVSTLVASGSGGNTVGNLGDTFDTGISGLPLLLRDLGLDPTTSIPYSAGLYLDIEGDANRYLVTDVSGSVLTLSTTFAPGENSDSFYSTSLISGTKVDIAFGVRVRGESVLDADGNPDLDKVADTYHYMGRSYSERRVWMIVPDQAEFILNGEELSLPGGYAAGLIAAMVTEYRVSQSFTNLPMGVISGVKKVFNRFKPEQLDRMAGGGCYILTQAAPGSPVIAREALTTDTTSEATIQDIPLKELDLLAKMLRLVIRPSLGVQNIEKGTIDDINTKVDAVRDLLVSKKLILGFDVLELGVSSSSVSRLAMKIRAYTHYALTGVDITIYL